MSRLYPCLRYHYLNASFEGGTVGGSDHPENEVYVSFIDDEKGELWRHELTRSEALAMIACLAHALFINEQEDINERAEKVGDSKR